MKTINSKLRKAGIESLTVLTIVFATCYTISAQGARFENRFNNNEELALFGMNKTASVNAIKKEAAADLSYFAEALKEENESELMVEAWMTDAAYFGMAELEAETEEVLEVEDWMINELLFSAEKEEVSQEKPATVIPEKKPKTYGVTFPGAQFGRRAFILVEMEDSKLELEEWMIDNRVWKVKK
jgi:hypothetical protein